MSEETKNKIQIIEFTDPVCTWCWGSEPVLRKLENCFGEQIDISYIMGGLVKDITQFYDSFNDIGGDPENSNKNIAKHWLEASKRHGMPVEENGFKLFTKELPSTYPQNVAYKAAQIQDEKLAIKFLRRIREASAAEAKLTNSTEILVELASEIGLNIARFLEDFSNGTAQRAFEKDLELTAKYKAQGFPAFLLRFENQELMLHGYKTYEEFVATIKHLTKGSIVENELVINEKSILKFINKYQSVAMIEIQMSFNLSLEELETFLDSMLKRRIIDKRKVGNGYFITSKNSMMSCDSETGLCNI